MFLAIAVALGALGFFIGRHRGRTQPLAPIPVLRAGVGLLAACFLMIPLSGLLRFDALGWLGGLSLMFLLPTLVPLLLAYAVGWALGARRLPVPRLSRMAPVLQPVGESPEETPARPGEPWLQRPAAKLLLVMAGVAAGFMVAIGLGYRLSGNQGPAVLGMLLWPGLLLAAAVIAGFRHVQPRPAPRG